MNNQCSILYNIYALLISIFLNRRDKNFYDKSNEVSIKKHHFVRQYISSGSYFTRHIVRRANIIAGQLCLHDASVANVLFPTQPQLSRSAESISRLLIFRLAKKGIESTSFSDHQ